MKDKKLTIKISEDLREKFNIINERKSISGSALIRKWVEEYVKMEDNKEMMKTVTENLKKVDLEFIMKGIESEKDQLANPSQPTPFLVANRNNGKVFVKAYTSPEYCDLIKVMNLSFIVHETNKDPEILARIIKEDIAKYIENELWMEFN